MARRDEQPLANPCMNPNAYDPLSRPGDPPLPPCGRPLGHLASAPGRGMTGPWGMGGHSVYPGPHDTPTKKVIWVPGHWAVIEEEQHNREPA